MNTENQKGLAAKMRSTSHYYSVEPEEVVKTERNHSRKGDNIAETVLSIVAYVFLFLGIIVSFVIGIQFMSKSLTSIGICYIVGGSIISLVMWAALMVTVNISNNIRQIKRLLQNQ